MNKPGILLVNLGSPDSPSVPDVREYLREFLMDGRVIDVPLPLRYLLVHGLILPFRPKHSAEAYDKIWTQHGSPLVATGRRVRDELAARIDAPVEIAMRYRNPSIADALQRMRDAGVDSVVVLPMFPHYAMSSYETAVERVKSLADGLQLTIVPPYYAHPEFISALVASAEPWLAQPYDHLLFSFHGLPERHLHKADPTGSHCLKIAKCCDTPSLAHDTCYRVQCYQTVKYFAAAVGIDPDRYSTAFQSRLGRDKWIEPHTDKELVRLAQSGVKRLVVMCPAFVADCLETVEELGIRGKETFLQAGGQEFTLVPCLNDHPRWIAAIEQISRAHLLQPALATQAY